MTFIHITGSWRTNQQKEIVHVDCLESISLGLSSKELTWKWSCHFYEFIEMLYRMLYRKAFCRYVLFWKVIWKTLFLLFLKILLIFLEMGESKGEREKKRERIDQLPPVCALIRNQTCHLLVYEKMFQSNEPHWPGKMIQLFDGTKSV